ncbi:hypothetical protein [Levilactobacillus acidifarinae]|uniref:D-alanyl-D-alanine carboxypeptidase n=1 Tax=Levilactobacillus acidifarinae DSM 19394 = JCM 15949 TaxID=1423715 RepID=A0A0R1LDX5_9LACO|nr:hypothetical protein [Levilactobacillus acidifarinae]KRK93995.1 hypothetical protein FD25_GL001324 [Levilactobacillus acidifarinae DSM 19394]GEO68882.1 hypothetical protein LAC03_07920 [Levilactobacillus acidifarinae]
MQKAHVLMASALLTTSLGLGILASNQPTTAQAKVRAAKVLKTTAIKKQAYNINGGYLYKNAKLTKKATSSRHLLKTTLYTYKSANVKKVNGKKAVYYYVMNKSGSIKGWAWRGNLQKKRSYAQQKKDIKAVLGIIRTMSQDSQNDLLGDFSDITPQDAYDGLSNVVSWSTNNSDTTADYAAAGKFYKYFQGRFNSITNAKLAAIYASYVDAMNSSDSADEYDASYNLFNALGDAISSLN